MAHAYTPGLKVKEKTVIIKERRLPLKGEVMVQKGERVQAGQVVARTELPGNVVPLNMAGLLAVPPEEVHRFMLKKEGDHVERGEIFAQTPGLFGFLFKRSVAAPTTGTVESISSITGQVMLREPPIPVEVIAYVDGTVSEVLPGEGVVITTVGSMIQGIFGVGGEVLGKIRVVASAPDEPFLPSQVPGDAQGEILIGGRSVTAETLRAAREAGAVGVVVGGIDSRELRNFLGYDIGVAITGNEDVGLTLVITEGFGEIAMAQRTFELFQKLDGQAASMNGATQIRAGVIRPEVIVSYPTEDPEAVAREERKHLSGVLDIGRNVRVIRAPFFGKIGKVVALPPEPTLIDTEAKVRVVVLDLDGQRVVIPRANVELIEV